MVLRENMETLSNMNFAATRTIPAYSEAPAAYQNHGQPAAGTEIIADKQNPNLLYPVEHDLSAASNLDGVFLDPAICFEDNQALVDPPTSDYPSSLQTPHQNDIRYPQLGNKTLDEIFAQIENDEMHQEQQCVQTHDPVATAPADPIHTSFSNDVPALMPNTSSAGYISVEEFLIDLGVVRADPRKPPGSSSVIGNAYTTAPIPTHNQIIHTEQDQRFQQQSQVLSITENDGVIGRRRGSSDPINELEDAKQARKMRRMIMNRASAARSRARRIARDLEMEIELQEMKEENKKLKNTLLETEAEIKKGGEKLRRTKSWA